MNRGPRKLLARVNKLIRWSAHKIQRQKQKKQLLRHIRLWLRTEVKQNVIKVRKRRKQSVRSEFMPYPLPLPNPSKAQPIHLKANKIKNNKKEPSKNILSINMDKIDIFRFPIIDWDYRWQRPQQIAVKFAEDGHRVFYFSLNTLLIHKEDAAYAEISEHILIKELQKNVWSVQICSHQPLNAYRNIIKDPLDFKYLNWSIQSLKEKFQIDHTLSIVDLPFWAPLALDLENNKVIYDCMDEHSGFSNVSSDLLEIEPMLIKNADIVVASSEVLFHKVKQLNPSTYLVRNAGEYKHFSQQAIELAPELANIKGPIIGYIGTIADWFDIKLIDFLAQRNKDWTFVLVGHNYLNDDAPVEYTDNIIFVGEKPYSELPKYLYCFDVCLIPFLVNELTLATNPVKVYEYLASGRPVVSSKLPELNLMDEFVRLAGTPEEFEQAIGLALNDNSEETIQKRKEFAALNTWDERYKDLKNIIKEKLFSRVSVIIVTYNNWAYTKQCLESLFRNSRYPNLEVIIVDNASTDETKEGLADITHPDVKLVFSSENMGFSGGNSLGCTISSGKYIVLLNNDTIVPPGWIQRLINPLKKSPDFGMIGPMSNLVGNDQMLDHFVGSPLKGPDPNWLKDFYEMYKGRIRLTELLGFYCVAIKKEVYEKAGHLDTEYSIGMFEDDDYCERVKNLGYKLAIVEDAFVYHHGSASFKNMPTEQYFSIFNKNKLYFESKWGKKWTPHPKPVSLFLEVSDAESFAKILKENGTKSILVLGKKEWTASNIHWQQLTRSLCKEGRLVIAYVNSYHGHEIKGIRKVGPSFYLTNQLDIMEKSIFDLILYCGETEVHDRIYSYDVRVDAPSYGKHELSELVRTNVRNNINTSFSKTNMMANS